MYTNVKLVRKGSLNSYGYVLLPHLEEKKGQQERSPPAF